MKTNKYIILLVIALASALAFSCSDDETIVVFDEEEPYPPPSNDDGMINNIIQPSEYAMSFPYELKQTLGYKDTDYYPLEGTGTVTLKHRIYPFYVYEAVNGNGDYYVIQSEVIVENDNMYQGSKKYDYADDKYKAEVTLLGYYLKNVKTSYELLDNNGKVVGIFPFGQTPTPFTTIGSTTYTSGFSFSFGGKIRLGISPKDSTYIGLAKLSPVVLKIGYTNKVTRNFNDLEVINNSTNNAAVYDFHVTRCPADNAGPSIYTPTEPALISISTDLHSEEWVWHVPATLDNEGEDVHFKIRQKVELIYGAAQSQFSLHTLGLRHYLSENTYSIKKEAVFDIIPPCRNQMGNVKIVNKNKNMYIKDIKIQKEGAKYPSALSNGSLPYKGEFERSLDVGRYMITFSMGRKGNDVKTYTSDGYITVTKDKTLVLYSDFDFEPESN